MGLAKGELASFVSTFGIFRRKLTWGGPGVVHHHQKIQQGFSEKTPAGSVSPAHYWRGRERKLYRVTEVLSLTGLAAVFVEAAIGAVGLG